jgi:hypothetical protein
MSREKEGKEKSGKKAATKNLKEKRADKAAKRNEKGSRGSSPIITPITKSKK